MTSSPLDTPDMVPRRAMGVWRLALVTALVLFILAWEYDWLTTPWWQKTIRYCGSLGVAGVFNDIRGWLGW